ncbi:hypothetical protein MMC18_001095 [Xylographa bjoerkii]|nr:hypothetical protein [Xylographa bjoerkii]
MSESSGSELGGGIAIIGTACRVAGANSPSELWDLLASSRDVQSEITRFNARGYYHPDGGPRKGMTNVKDAYMMDNDSIDRFDNVFFNTSPQMAIATDPQQRLLLEISYEAIESAGIPLEKFFGSDTAVFAGMEGTDYHTVLARDIDATPRYLATGTATCMGANRISYFYNLSGPSISVDTACSSTMAALHQAVRSLQGREASMAMVCGAKLIINPDMFMPSSELGFLSPSGRCRSFDATGDGYGRGEGVLAILLKPLESALTDNDPIRAVIRGTRLNQDGRTQGITLPSANAQRQNMECLYKRIGLSPADVQYIEAHGTGTAVGDPLEFSAINAVFGSTFRQEPLIVGSVKSNIGHLEACAALAGIIKTVECLERASIPPQMHFVTPNPKINFDKVRIPTTTIGWPKTHDRIRRAAVNTFGAGGTNGHCVLESYPKPSSEGNATGAPLLFKVSAEDKYALRRLCLRYAEYSMSKAPDLHDLAFTLLSRRSTLSYSLFFSARTIVEAIKKFKDETLGVHTKSNLLAAKVVFVFTGQGAQWPSMGKALIENSRMFSTIIEECENALAALHDRPSWSLREELLKSADCSNIYKAAYSQPLCTALQIGLVTLWKHWGLTPMAVVGHSSGEIAAAYTAGFISLRDAMVIAFYRGLYLRCLNGSYNGAMCAVGLGKSDSQTLLEPFGDRVQLAAVNSPTSCTLSGDKDGIQQIVTMCEEEKIFCRVLRSEIAYHSHHMSHVAGPYERALSNAKVRPLSSGPECDMFSSVTGQQLRSKDCLPSYWKENMVSRVEFSAALRGYLGSSGEDSLFVEIGPHPALKGPAQETICSTGRDSVTYLHSCLRGKNGFETLLESAGALIARGLKLKTANINAREIVAGRKVRHHSGTVLTDVPTYSWDHKTPFWAESRISRNVRFRKTLRHELLGSPYLEDIPSHPSWRNLLMLKEVPWLVKIRDEGASDLPPTTYLLMALEAARQQSQIAEALNATCYRLSEVQFWESLPFAWFHEVDTTIEMHLRARKINDSSSYWFEILSITADDKKDSTRHCSGQFDWTDTTPEGSEVPSSEVLHDQRLLHQSLKHENPRFSTLENLALSSAGISGTFESSSELVNLDLLDPLVFESILRSPPLMFSGQNLPATYKISSVQSIVIPATLPRTRTGRFRVVRNGANSSGGCCDINITLDESHILVSDMSFEVDKLVHVPPALKSLYFEPVTLPDISRIVPQDSMSIGECLRLVTHKWPMCDIAAINLTAEDLTQILEGLPGVQLGERPSFRSFQLTGEVARIVPARVRVVEKFVDTAKFQLVLARNVASIDDLGKFLLPNSILCINTSQGEEDTRGSFPLSKLCDVVGIGEETWTLFRAQPGKPEYVLAPKTTVFVRPKRGIQLITKIEVDEYVHLTPSVVKKFCERKQERYSAIVIDDIEKSVISTWPGNDLVPWLQNLLEYADKILWVTKQKQSNPFTNIAGTLLRTIQSEQPSIRVTWLVLSGDQPESTIQESIESAYTTLLSGENEIKLEVRDLTTRILRYRPDDELSASIGLIPPQSTRVLLDDRDYEVSLSSRERPILLAFNRDNFRDVGPEKIRVEVEASVIDSGDISDYDGQKPNQPKSSLGTFFAGCVTSELSDEFPQGSKIVGFASSCHCKVLDVTSTQVQLYDKETSPEEAAASFACIATALCVIDGTARARPGDTIKLSVPGRLKEAIVHVGANIDLEFLSPDSAKSANFVISLTRSDGLRVNGASVDIMNYLESKRGIDMVGQAWSKKLELMEPLEVFELASCGEAFRAAQTNSYSTVILHVNPGKAQKSVMTYKMATRLFTGDGAYVIVGGVGGLGRFVCRWMVENGAKRIVAISRSGVKSDEARQTWEEITAMGITFEVIRADACDRKAMSEALSGIRKACAIKGIINMAMLLGDAPMADMEGWQWDIALRLKIDSSWIMHEETLNDPLDFFIMFSSIASVLGNRNQGGYNVGNTFLNALAEYRRSMGLTAISIALGAMTDIGVLHDLGKQDLLQTLSRSGLSPLCKTDLAKIMEAAVVESQCSDRSLILTGLEMFDRIDGKLVGSQDQTQLYWTELPEFGFLQHHSLSSTTANAEKQLSIGERLAGIPAKDVPVAMQDAFLAFVAQLLGFDASVFNSASSLAIYGLDSLSAVSCQYWFHRELSIDVAVSAVLNAASISELIKLACSKLPSLLFTAEG